MAETDPLWSYGKSKVIEAEAYWSYGKNVAFCEIAVVGGGVGRLVYGGLVNSGLVGGRLTG